MILKTEYYYISQIKATHNSSYSHKQSIPSVKENSDTDTNTDTDTDTDTDNLFRIKALIKNKLKLTIHQLIFKYKSLFTRVDTNCNQTKPSRWRKHPICVHHRRWWLSGQKRWVTTSEHGASRKTNLESIPANHINGWSSFSIDLSKLIYVK